MIFKKIHNAINMKPRPDIILYIAPGTPILYKYLNKRFDQKCLKDLKDILHVKNKNRDIHIRKGIERLNKSSFRLYSTIKHGNFSFRNTQRNVVPSGGNMWKNV